MTNQDEVTNIYDCYRRAMASVGWQVQLPTNTDPSKTYAYRAIKKFLDKTKEWNLDPEVVRALVREVVLYGKRNGLLRKGTALLNMKSVLQICQDYLSGEITKADLLINDIGRAKRFIDRHIDNDNGVAGTLVTRTRRDGYANLTQWYRSGEIPLSFVSISAGCRKALNLLPPDERSLFPSDEKLLRNRIKILGDSNLRSKLSEILDKDLLTSGIIFG